MAKQLWWGNRNKLGGYLVKRYVDHSEYKEALKSDSYMRVYTPFKAANKEEALSIIKAK